MKTESNYQDFLKTILIAGFIIDHLGLYFFPDYKVCRLIGRIVMPGFCFFAGYNFKPIITRTKILILGLILVATDLVFGYETMPTNILLPIYIGQIYIYIFAKQLKNFFLAYVHATIIAMLGCFTWQFVDYGTLVIAIMILGYNAKYDKDSFKISMAISIIIGILYTNAEFMSIINNYFISYIIISAVQYIVMIIMPLAAPIRVNLKMISRNSLAIYFADLMIMKIGFYFWLITKFMLNG